MVQIKTGPLPTSPLPGGGAKTPSPSPDGGAKTVPSPGKGRARVGSILVFHLQYNAFAYYGFQLVYLITVFLV